MLFYSRQIKHDAHSIGNTKINGVKHLKNIDNELNQWAIQKIKSMYPDDIDLLIGQMGGCKLPTDEQNLVFDFFVPATKKGYQMAKTFVIEDMGYDLYPNSWERLEKIVDLQEPRMIFAFAKGEVLYARTREAKERYEQLRKRLEKNLADTAYTYQISLVHINTAMEIFQTMLFEESLRGARKAAGGIANFLMTSLAFVNGTYLKNGYGNLLHEMGSLKEIPVGFEEAYKKMLEAGTVEELKKISHQMLLRIRAFFLERKPVVQKAIPEYNYDDLAFWYHEARYTFRKIAYYCEQNRAEEVFQLGCYMQIEFDAIREEFGLKELDMLSLYNSSKLSILKDKAHELEQTIIQILKENHAKLYMYDTLDEFLLEEGYHEV